MKILRSGIALIQDRGRLGYQAFGMGTAGACDQYAYRMGNLLVGNEHGEASLECILMGPTIEFEEDTVVAITGGNFSATLNGVEMGNWCSYRVNSGDTLELGGVMSGRMEYIAVAGGIDVPLVMGSRSTYVRAKIGGLDGRNLKNGDRLSIGSGNLLTAGRQLDDRYIPTYETDTTVRVVLGPQDDAFTEKGINTFLNSPYQVTNSCDRMGYRLQGDAIEHIKGADIISDGIPLGAVQVVGDNQPIIMLADRQTTGGYTKIATLVTADIPKVAQSSLDSIIRFKSICVSEAYMSYRQYEEQFKNLRWPEEQA